MTAVCDTLEVSRAGYYAWFDDVETARERRDRELMPIVRRVFWQHKRRYGARRIALELGAGHGHRDADGLACADGWRLPATLPRLQPDDVRGSDDDRDGNSFRLPFQTSFGPALL